MVKYLVPQVVLQKKSSVILTNITILSPDFFCQQNQNETVLYFNRHHEKNKRNRLKKIYEDLDRDLNQPELATKINEPILDNIIYHVFPLFDDYGCNYFHLMIDLATKIIQYHDLKQKYPDLKILLLKPEMYHNQYPVFGNPKSPIINECLLELLSLFQIKDEDIYYHHPGNLYHRLIYSRNPTHTPNQHGFFNRSENLKDYLPTYQAYQKHTENITPDSTLPKKIYISRRHNLKRGMKNEDELVAPLINLGFTELFCEKMTLIEKIKSMKSADYVVGLCGAGMVNMIFCRPKTIICIIANTYMHKLPMPKVPWHHQYTIEVPKVLQSFTKGVIQNYYFEQKVINRILRHIEFSLTYQKAPRVQWQ